MRSLEQIVDLNAKACGITIEQNWREALAGQHIPHSESSKKDAEECELFGHVPAWSKKLGISEDVLRSRLQDAPAITAQMPNGSVLENSFFAESDVLHLCADVLGFGKQSEK